MKSDWIRPFVFILIVGISGCGPRSVPVPAYNPGAMATEALALYDANKDGRLSVEELKKCPSLLESLPQIDKNKDNALDADELEERFRQYAASKTGLFDLSLTIYQGGQPLVGATVTMVPEAFMGSVVKPATGKSDSEGHVRFRAEGNEYDGLALGCYRIEVSLKDEAGKEKIPVHYNRETTLGKEINLSVRRWELKLGY